MVFQHPIDWSFSRMPIIFLWDRSAHWRSMPSSCCRNCPSPGSRSEPPARVSHLPGLTPNVIRPSGRAATGPPHWPWRQNVTAHRPRVALEYRQETRIDSDLATLFRLPTEVIRPLGEGLFSFLA